MAKHRVTHLDLPRNKYRILLDRRWKLEDLTQYTKNYEQAYFAYFALYWISRDGGSESLIFRSVANNLQSYPWKGGYSVVSFYTGLKRTVGRRNVPEVQAIRYASPGYLDLILHLPVAVQVALSVASIAGSIGTINGVYNNIYRGMRERELNTVNVERAKLNLAKEHMDFLKKSCEDLGKPLGIRDVDQLIEMSGNELRALKVIQSIFRRVRVLSSYQVDKKAMLTVQDSSDEK